MTPVLDASPLTGGGIGMWASAVLEAADQSLGLAPRARWRGAELRVRLAAAPPIVQRVAEHA